MGIRNPKREELRRLENKTLDARFKTMILEGLNCSPFEAEAVLGVVHEVYLPFLASETGKVVPWLFPCAPTGVLPDQTRPPNLSCTRPEFAEGGRRAGSNRIPPYYMNAGASQSRPGWPDRSKQLE